VGDDAADEERPDLRKRPAGERDPGVRRGAGEVEHRERDRDRREVRPEEGDRAGGGEQPEVALAQRSELEPPQGHEAIVSRAAAALQAGSLWTKSHTFVTPGSDPGF